MRKFHLGENQVNKQYRSIRETRLVASSEVMYFIEEPCHFHIAQISIEVTENRKDMKFEDHQNSYSGRIGKTKRLRLELLHFNFTNPISNSELNFQRFRHFRFS